MPEAASELSADVLSVKIFVMSLLYMDGVIFSRLCFQIIHPKPQENITD